MQKRPVSGQNSHFRAVCRELPLATAVDQLGRDMIETMIDRTANDPDLEIRRPEPPLNVDVEQRLRAELEACPDVAFAHLCLVDVVGCSPAPQLSVFVWLTAEAVGSHRAALNLVCEAVARALPEDEFLDVLILNSVPELLTLVEETDCLIVERDPRERRRALRAATGEPEKAPPEPRRRRWFR